MAETKKKSVFDILSSIDISEYVKEKNGLSYLPWAKAWEIVKRHFPDATYKVYPQIMDEYGNTRFWHDDGKSGWVSVGVTIEGEEQIENLAIMDYRNQAIPASCGQNVLPCSGIHAPIWLHIQYYPSDSASRI